MKNLNLKHAILSSLVVYIFGIIAFVGSYFVPIMEDPDLQANIVLMAAIVPAAYLGAYLYYRRGYTSHGFRIRRDNVFRCDCTRCDHHRPCIHYSKWWKSSHILWRSGFLANWF